MWFDYEPQSLAHKMAVVICLRCEVRRQCYVSAIERHERYGIWGGMDFTRLDRRRRKAPINF